VSVRQRTLVARRCENIRATERVSASQSAKASQVPLWVNDQDSSATPTMTNAIQITASGGGDGSRRGGRPSGAKRKIKP
jgi:hypothetical protein